MIARPKLGALVVTLVVALGSTMPAAGAKKSDAEPIKVGTILPIDSPEFSMASEHAALVAAVRALNKRGGLGGHPVELVTCDDKNDANRDASCARKMVEEGVVATLGDTASGSSELVNEAFEAAGIARIGIFPTGLSDFQSPVVFTHGAGPVYTYTAAGVFLVEAGYTKLALVMPDVPATRALKPLVEPAIKQAGGEILLDVFVDAGAVDYSQYVAAIESAGADGAILMIDENVSARFVDALNDLGVDLAIGAAADSPTTKTLRGFGKKVYQKMVLASSFPAPSDSPKAFPALKQFLADMKHSGISELQGGASVLQGSQVMEWAAVLALEKLTERLTTIDAASVLQACKTATDIDLDGLIPPWTPNAEQTGIFKRFPNTYVYRMKFDGKRIVAKKPPVDAAAMFPSSS